jgi:hypothetical protein
MLLVIKRKRVNYSVGLRNVLSDSCGLKLFSGLFGFCGFIVVSIMATEIASMEKGIAPYENTRGTSCA